jgi:hypothetical protein
MSAQEADIHLMAILQDENQEQDNHDGEQGCGEPHPARTLHTLLGGTLPVSGFFLSGVAVTQHHILAPEGSDCNGRQVNDSPTLGDPG